MSTQVCQVTSEGCVGSELAQAFVASTGAVFSMMLDWPVELKRIALGSCSDHRYDVSGIIGFSGRMRGTAVVSLSRDLALAAAQIFLGESAEWIDANVADMVGEFANMIAGNAKDRLPIHGVDLGLPAVVTGNEFAVNFEPGVLIEQLTFAAPRGQFMIEIGMRAAA